MKMKTFSKLLCRLLLGCCCGQDKEKGKPRGCPRRSESSKTQKVALGNDTDQANGAVEGLLELPNTDYDMLNVSTDDDAAADNAEDEVLPTGAVWKRRMMVKTENFTPLVPTVPGVKRPHGQPSRYPRPQENVTSSKIPAMIIPGVDRQTIMMAPIQGLTNLEAFQEQKRNLQILQQHQPEQLQQQRLETVNDGTQFLNTPVTPVTILKPTDIPESTLRPFLIDPSSRATEWLKPYLKESRLEVINQQDSNFSTALELAVRFSKTLIIEEVDGVDPVLYPLLGGDLISQGPRFVVQIGEKNIDYNEEFCLFLTTRNPAPEIPPDAASVITEVNFTTTKAGLTGQLLAATIQHEKPELEEKKTSLLKQEEDLKIERAKLEESLLEELANAKGNILENKELLDSLNKTKASSITIADSLAESVRPQASLNQSNLGRLYQALGLEDGSTWSNFSRSSQCEQEFPSVVVKKTSFFQQVLVVQAIRPDRLQSAMSLFACRALDLHGFYDHNSASSQNNSLKTSLNSPRNGQSAENSPRYDRSSPRSSNYDNRREKQTDSFPNGERNILNESDRYQFPFQTEILRGSGGDHFDDRVISMLHMTDMTDVFRVENGTASDTTRQKSSVRFSMANERRDIPNNESLCLGPTDNQDADNTYYKTLSQNQLEGMTGIADPDELPLSAHSPVSNALPNITMSTKAGSHHHTETSNRIIQTYEKNLAQRTINPDALSEHILLELQRLIIQKEKQLTDIQKILKDLSGTGQVSGKALHETV